MDLHVLRGSHVLVPHLEDPSWHFMSKLQYHFVSSPNGALGIEHIIIVGGCTIISYMDLYRFKWSNEPKYHNFWGDVDQA